MSGMTLDGEKLTVNPEHLQVLVEALRVDRNLTVRVVGHDYSKTPLKQQIEKSTNYAEQLKTLLVALDIPEKRLEVHGVGSLAPMRKPLSGGRGNRDGDSFRIELVAAD
jgi:hypothetical protein